MTLVELLVVVAIVALVTAAAMLSMRDGRHDALEREAVRLAALLEGARAQSRASGVPVVWQGSAQGFVFAGLQPAAAQENPLPVDWKTPVAILRAGRLDALRHDGTGTLVLGPEPILPPQRITLALPEQPDVQRTVGTDGVRPFQVMPVQD